MPDTSQTEGGPDPVDVLVGLRTRALRKEKGISQDQLGRAIGVTFQQVQKYERGTNRISASMLVRIANVLEVSPASLLPEGGVAEAGNPQALNLLARLRGANELLQAYADIPSYRLRRLILQMARGLAAEARGEADVDVEEDGEA